MRPGPRIETIVRRRGLRRWAVAGACACAALAAGIAWRGRGAPDLPRPRLDGVDPAVISAIDRSMSRARASPSSAGAWGELGMVLLAHDFGPEASDCFRRAADLEGSDPRWPYFHGQTLLSTRPEEALPWLERTVSLCGDVPGAPRLRLAEALFELDRIDEAEAQFRRALEADARSGRAHLGLARILLRRNALEATGAHLAAASEDPRALRAAKILLAQVHARQGAPGLARGAREEADRAAERGWQDPYLEQLNALRTGLKPGLVRADVLIGTGRNAEALELLSRLAREYPGAPWVWILLGRTRVKLRDLDGAERALLEALRLEPTSVEAQFRLGVSLSLRGKYVAAAEWFQRAVAIKPDFARAWFNLGQCLGQLGRPTESIEAFRSAIRHEPENAEGLAYLGHMLARTGALEEAEQLLIDAARLRPASPWIADRLAEVEARRDGR